MTSAATLICPKCRGEMHSYERNGVVVDQCDECRGIFLDRGELERLLDAESPRPTRDDHHNHHDHHDRHHEPSFERGFRDDDHEYRDERPGKRRRRPSSLLSDLLGGGED